MTSAHIQLSIPSELGQVRFLAAALRALLDEVACPADQIATVELCLVEAANNAVKHAYHQEPGHTIEVEVTASAEQVTLAVCDVGSAMPAGKLERARAARAHLAREDAEPSLDRDSLAENGYGLGLITELMDFVTYRSDDGRNALTMTMQLAPACLPK